MYVLLKQAVHKKAFIKNVYPNAHFSKISTALKRKHSKDNAKLFNVIEYSLTTPMQTAILQKVFNVRNRLKPCVSEMKNQSQPQVFKLVILRAI